VRKLTFTGSTAVGKRLTAACAPTLKRVSMELGGNAPFIVFEDANIDRAVDGILASKFRNTGQTCVCANRILVHEQVYDALADRLTAAVRSFKVGNGLEGKMDQGPLINARAIEKVERHVADAVSRGATVKTGGQRIEKLAPGYYYEPTVLTDAKPDMLLATEETFGPVAPLFRFRDESEAIELANASAAGLSAYAFTTDLNRFWRVSEQLQCGIVGINTGLISTEIAPFGGVKESGFGREGSKYGVDDYLSLKQVCIGDVS
jgi:succinate-semialdehyde dehydrogenase/glutarate-semialdehyde dehydrogenase